MTTAELIKQLQAMPQDLTVYLENPDRLDAEEVKSVRNEWTSFYKHDAERNIVLLSQWKSD